MNRGFITFSYSFCCIFSFCFIISLTPSNLLAQHTTFSIVDFDGDGSSDPTGLRNQFDGSPNELVYHSFLSGEQIYSSFEFGQSKDLPVPADYSGDGVTDYSVVRSDGETLSWIIRSSTDDSIITTELGSNKDSALSGCDLDGDLKADVAILKKDGTFQYIGSRLGDKSFKINLAEDESVIDLTCGGFSKNIPTDKKPKEKKVNAIGARHDLLLLLKSEEGHRILITSATGVEIFAQQVAPGQALEPADINNDGLLDFLLFRKPKSRASLFIFSQTASQPLSFKRTRQRLNRSISDFLPIYDATSDTWLVFFKSDKQRLFTYSDRLKRTVRTTRYKIEGEQIIRATAIHNFEESSSGGVPKACKNIENFADGSGGRLWKAAEHGGTVALFPQCEFTATRVTAVYNKEVLSNLENTGGANADSCGDRIHFRDRGKNPSFFPQGTILVVETTGKKVFCYSVRGDISSRID